MYLRQILAALLPLVTVVVAWQSPQYNGYTRRWQATFIGQADALPNSNNWNVINSAQVYNNELQRYTNKKANIRFNGNGALQLIPRRDATAPGGWTSGRIESKYTLTPTAGKITRVESSLRIAGNPQKNKQGLWPAFWMLGASYRQGVKWPECGEIDIMENINGQSIGYGVVHCDKGPGGACNEPIGLASTTALPDNQFHVWRVEIDRTNSDFKKQTITWYMDDVQFHRVTGEQVNNSGVWATLAQKPLYIILNVAMGGDWAGSPNANTWGGTGSMMEIGYVAHYVSN
ncbi:uncharacterized protein J7T54_002710 [Emericellopsis cladophorae]|uniref:GH16 domain-containing protein n=1 Tax=Emericellopsis cladophorae TaxID=2686198 RepID=A0A9Q0BB66_9HYPO|nr:uncharacterized protein J7T54_002710 [Emericellopsis cladophorae]KAI6778175.1 hypothetical protein J7T54_002710 [Emericellopsis cladophorae]